MLVEVIGDLPINELSQKHGRLFSSTLEKLPPRRKTDGRFKDKSINEIIQMDKTRKNTLLLKKDEYFLLLISISFN